MFDQQEKTTDVIPDVRPTQKTWNLIFKLETDILFISCPSLRFKNLLDRILFMFPEGDLVKLVEGQFLGDLGPLNC